MLAYYYYQDYSNQMVIYAYYLYRDYPVADEWELCSWSCNCNCSLKSPNIWTVL